MSSKSLKVWARITPVWRNSASYTRSVPAKAPVCETAALAPASERPILKATIGLPAREARKAASRNLLGCRIDSMYKAITRVASSSTNALTKSESSKSTSLLVEISFDKPTPRAAARDSKEPKMPPLCETTPIGPTGKWSISKAPEGDSTIPSVRLTKPMVLGPRMRMAPAASSNCACLWAPMSPVSP